MAEEVKRLVSETGTRTGRYNSRVDRREFGDKRRKYGSQALIGFRVNARKSRRVDKGNMTR